MDVTGQNMSDARRGRGDERVRLRGRAYLALPGQADAPPYQVELEDLSISGAGMVGPVEIHPGSAVVLLLELANHPAHGILGHVVCSKPLENHQFRVGMAFDATEGPTIQRIRYAFFPHDGLF